MLQTDWPIYISVGLFMVDATVLAAFVFRGGRRNTNLPKFTYLVQFGYFAVQVVATALLIYGLYRGVGIVSAGITGIFAILLTSYFQLYLQTTWIASHGLVESSRLKILVQSTRFSVVGLTVIILFGVLDSRIGAVLLWGAKRFDLTEINRIIFIWFRAPLSLLISQLIIAGLAALMLRLQLPSRSLRIDDSTDRLLFERLQKIAAKVGVTHFKVRLITLGHLKYFRLQRVARTLFLSEGLNHKIPTPEFDYLVAFELSGIPLKQTRNRLFYASSFMMFLVLPYLLAVHYLLYHLPSESLLLLGWLMLYLGLFVAQFFEISRFRKLQRIERTTFALNKLQASRDLHNRAWEMLRNLNQGQFRIPGIFTPPFHRPPVKNCEPPRTSQFAWRVLSLIVITASLLAGAYVYLAPGHRLVKAALDGDLENVKSLLEKKVNANKIDLITHQSPLLAAAQNGRAEVIKLLLEHQANPNLKLKLPLSPLLIACERGNLEAVKLLISARADVQFSGAKGYTPLMLASAHGHAEIARVLLASGASLNARSNHGTTPLMFAVQYNQLPSVKLLLAQGAYLYARDADGDSATDIAKRKKLVSMAQLLESP